MALSVCRIILIVLIIVFVLLAVLCHIVALCTDFWLRSSSLTQSDFLNVGLWRACFDEYRHPHEDPEHTYSGCHDLYSDEYAKIRDWLIPSWLISARALSIIALILQIIGIVFLVILLVWVICEAMRCCDDEAGWCDRCIIYLTPIIFVLAGVFLMSTAMVFADSAYRLQCKDLCLRGGPPYDNHLGYSWGFEIASCILTFISAGLIVWLAVATAHKRKYNEYAGAKS